MVRHALVLADRRCGALRPMFASALPALLPAGGKPVLEHCLEDLWEAGVREVVVTVPQGGDAIRQAVGTGERFGLAVRYLEVSDHYRPSEVPGMSGLPQDVPFLVARGDMLRGRMATRLLERAPQPGPDIVHGVVGAAHGGIALVNRHSRAGIDALRWPLLPVSCLGKGQAWVDMPDRRVEHLDSLASWFEACLGTLDGSFAGIVPDGRPDPRHGLLAAPRARIARSVTALGIARVGRHAAVHAAVELSGRVEIGDRSVIDEGAQLIESVVLPGTYVGRGVRLQNAVACGPWLYRRDLDSCQRVEDPLLLGGDGPALAAVETGRPAPASEPEPRRAAA